MPMLIPLAVAYGASALATSALVGTALAGTFAGAALAGVAGALAGSVAAKALAPKPSQQNMQSQGAGIVVNRSANNDPLNHVYGLRRVGGTVGVPGTRANYLGLVIAHCVGPVDRIPRMYVDGQPTWLPKFFQNYNYWKSYTGAAGQQADPMLVAEYPGLWTENHRGDAVAYTAAFVFANVAIFPTAPTWSADIFGELFYDTRDSGTRFSHNAALAALKHMLTSREDGGCGYDISLIDTATFTSAANHCEERVTIDWPTFTASAATDRLTFVTPQALRAGDSVTVSTSGTLPSPLAAATAYYVIPVDQSTVQLATTYDNALAGTAIDLTTAGSGTHTLKRVTFCVMEPERAWFPGASASGYQICFYAHPPTPYVALDQPYWLGDGVQLASTGTLPTGLSAGVTYYVIPNGVSSGQDAAGNYGQGVNAVRLASSYANAIAGTAISLTDTGSGNITLWLVDQERYTCDGVVNVDNDRINNLEQLLTACRGFVFFSGGKYKLKCDRADTPTGFVFDESNIVGGWELGLGGKRTIYNRVTATFFDPVSAWQANEAISDSVDDRTNSDNGLLLEAKIDLPFTANVFRAQRIAQIERKQSRFSRVASFTANNAALECEIGDVVYMTHPTPAWVNKTMRITDMEPLNSDEVKVTVREYDSSVYTVDPTTHVSPPLPGAVPHGANYWATLTPPNVTGLEIFGQANGSTFTGRDGKFDWRKGSLTGAYDIGGEPYGSDAGQNDPMFKDYQVQVLNGSTILRTEFVVDPAYTYTLEKNTEDNAGAPLRTFTLKVWQRTQYSKLSAQAAQLQASNPAPSLSNISLASIAGGFSYQFTSSVDGDYQSTEIHASLTSGFTPDSTTLRTKIPGIPNAGNFGQVQGLQQGFTYYVKFVPYDAFGAGTTSAEYSVTVTLIQVSSPAGQFGQSAAGPAPTAKVTKAFDGTGDVAGLGTVTSNITNIVFAPNTQALYVATKGSGNWILSAFDLNTLGLVKSLDLGSDATNDYNYRCLVYSPVTGYLYLLIQGGGIAVVDPASMTRVHSNYASPGATYAYAAACASNGKLYLGGKGGVNVLAFDPANPLAFISPFNIPTAAVAGVRGCYYHPAADDIVVIYNNDLKALDKALAGVTATVTPTNKPYGMAYCPQDGKMWVTCSIPASTYARLKSNNTLDTDVANTAPTFLGDPVYCPLNGNIYGAPGEAASPVTAAELFSSLGGYQLGFFHQGTQMMYAHDAPAASGHTSLLGYAI